MIVYAIFLCDEWKSEGSMRLDMICSCKRTLSKRLKKLLEEKTIEANIKDFNGYQVCMLNNYVDYCFIQEVKLNEEL